MDPEIIFVPSAFKHHVTEADIRRAYNNPISEDAIKVFHAMDMRPGTLVQLRD